MLLLRSGQKVKMLYDMPKLSKIYTPCFSLEQTLN